MHRVMIHPAVYNDCREAVNRAFELFPVDIPGKKILVKPNVLRKSKPEEGITTHPAVLAAVVDYIKERNPATLIVGDNPGIFSYGANETAFKETGLLEAAQGYYQNIGTDMVEVDFVPGFVDRLNVSRAIMEADVYISLPKFKTHGLTIVTGGIKNNYGILPGAQKAMLHRKAGSPKRFHELIVDVFRLRPPDLFIVDAVVGMEGNGPASPDLREINRILASDNVLALDATISRMMGLDPGKLRFIKRGKEAGLGEYNKKAIEIIGELRPIPDFKLPPLSGEVSAKDNTIRELIHSRTLLRPKADLELCTACGTCIEHCPVSALSMPEDLPIVDINLCITCFCCQEMCPEKAITLQAPGD